MKLFRTTVCYTLTTKGRKKFWKSWN